MSMTVVVARPSSGSAPNHFSCIVGEEAVLLQLVDESLTFPASGASLANIIEYCSPVVIRSTTLNCGLSLV